MFIIIMGNIPQAYRTLFRAAHNPCTPNLDPKPLNIPTSGSSCSLKGAMLEVVFEDETGFGDCL